MQMRGQAVGWLVGLSGYIQQILGSRVSSSFVRRGLLVQPSQRNQQEQIEGNWDPRVASMRLQWQPGKPLETRPLILLGKFGCGGPQAPILHFGDDVLKGAELCPFLDRLGFW